MYHITTRTFNMAMQKVIRNAAIPLDNFDANRRAVLRGRLSIVNVEV